MSEEGKKMRGTLIYGMLRDDVPSPDENRKMLEDEYRISIRTYDHLPRIFYICPTDAEVPLPAHGSAGGLYLYPWNTSWNDRIFGFCRGVGIDPNKTPDCRWHLIMFERHGLPDRITFSVAELSATEPVLIHVTVPDDMMGTRGDIEDIEDMAHAVLGVLPNASFILTREGVTVKDMSKEEIDAAFQHDVPDGQRDSFLLRLREAFLVRATAALYGESKTALEGTLTFRLGHDVKLGARATTELVRTWIDKLMAPEAVRAIGVLDVMLHRASPPIRGQCREILFGCFRYQDYEIKKAALEALVVHAVMQDGPVLSRLKEDLRPYRDDEIIGEDVRRFTGDG